MTSCKEMVEVSAATTSSRKNTDDQTMLSGIELKMPGRVMNTSDGPDEGSMPTLNTAGKNPSTGQYDLLAKKILLRVTYDEPSEESSIEIPDMSSDVTYE